MRIAREMERLSSVALSHFLGAALQTAWAAWRQYMEIAAHESELFAKAAWHLRGAVAAAALRKWRENTEEGRRLRLAASYFGLESTKR